MLAALLLLAIATPAAAAPRKPVSRGRVPQPSSPPLGPTLTASPPPLQRYASNRVIVKFKSGGSARSGADLGIQLMAPVSELLRSSGGAARATVDAYGASTSAEAQRFVITDGAAVPAKISELLASGAVDSAEPDYQVDLYKLPSDPGYTRQWHLPKVGSSAAWDTYTGSKKVKVCVIDSGARLNHPDLGANVLKGWNVVNSKVNPDPADPRFANYNDTLGHGTHVAGLLAALGNNRRGVTGMAWRVSLLVCRFIAESGTGYVFDAITCMRLCREEGAHIYSNSWGGVEYHAALLEEIQAIAASGALFVTAAGNTGLDLDGAPSYPASYKAPNQLTVAASTMTDELAHFSNYGGGTVHLAAPGVSMLSTTADGDYGVMSGTSMATPVVAGAAALLQGVAMNIYNTTLSAEKLRELILDNVDKVAGTATTLIGGGRLNVANAVQALHVEMGGVPVTPLEPPPPPAVVFPDCGKSALVGVTAAASSVYKNGLAERAVDGDCRNDMAKRPNACAATDPARSFPWWTAPLAARAEVVAIGITTRSDCCWAGIGGAVVMVGNETWTGSGSRSKFEECGTVPDSGIAWGKRMTIQCNAPLVGNHIAVYLPKRRTSLVLCEVDVVTTGGDLAPARTKATKPKGRRLLGRVGTA